MEYVYSDGGRAKAGYRGDTGDCATRAIAIATGLDYQTVYNLVNEHGKKERRSKNRSGKSSAREGIYKPTMRRIMASLGWEWTPTMHVGQGCTVHLRDGELPAGPLVVSLSRHYSAVIDGVIYDNHDPSRDGDRCVYGYWQPPTIREWAPVKVTLPRRGQEWLA
jgi:hypothetical protein